MTFDKYLEQHPYKPTRSFTQSDWDADMYEHWQDEYGDKSTFEKPKEAEKDHRIEVDGADLESMRKGHKQTLLVPVELQVQRYDTISVFEGTKRHVFEVLHVAYSGNLPDCVLSIKPQKDPF